MDVQSAANMRAGEPRPADSDHAAAECWSRCRPVAPAVSHWIGATS